MPQNEIFVAKITNTRLTKICVGIFALADRLPTSATLDWRKDVFQIIGTS